MKPTIADLSPRYQAQVRDQLAKVAHPRTVSVQPADLITFTCQQSKDEQNLNKTEAQYLSFLRAFNLPWVGIQSLTLKLGDDCRYTPDFAVLTKTGELQAHEVKGFWRDDAKVKIKVAARCFPWIRFHVAIWERKHKAWNITSVAP
jgi:hypothetical protein